MDEVDGTPFGRYGLIELLGRGGMGEVWRAYDTDTDRVVALKLLPAHLSDNEEFQRRFRREAHAAARLNSPHVIPIHHYGEIDGRLYLDMRLIKGRDLATVLDEGPLDPMRAVRIIGQVAEALHAAHEEGLLHRDIKPSNILLDKNDFAYLIDFGIARAADETRMTKSGSVIGTYHYIAPERLAVGADEDARADIYSLACVLYECLTGSPPFPGDTMPQLVGAHLYAPPPRPSTSQPELPAPVDEVIARGMAKDPDQRYATTVELADAARDAITVPIARPAPTPTQPPTEHFPSSTTLPATKPADNRVTAQPRTPKAASLASVKPVLRRIVWGVSPAPQISRRARIALIVGAIALVAAVIARLRPSLILPAGGFGLFIITALGIFGRIKIALILGTVVILAVAAAVVANLAFDKTESSFPMASGYGPQTVLPFTGLNLDGQGTSGVAVDSAGSLYVTDSLNARVLKLAAGSSTQTLLPFTGLVYPSGVAVDSAGDLYVVDYGGGDVLKLAAGSSTPTMLPFTGLSAPLYVAEDAAGTLYVTDFGNTRVVKLAAGSGTQSVLPFTGLKWPDGVVADSAGTLYVTDQGNNRVLKLPAGATTQQVLPFTGLNGPAGLAVDAAGNLYVADTFNNRLLKLPAGAATQSVLPFTGLSGPRDVAVDSAGNLYVNDTGNNRVVKLPVQ